MFHENISENSIDNLEKQGMILSHQWGSNKGIDYEQQLAGCRRGSGSIAKYSIAGL
jgi:hypothetical protein